MEKNMFSIIVPVYNVEKYLRNCLESLVNQTYDEYEIILVNDGSTDLSPDICQEYEKMYDNVRVIHKDNGGLSDARNKGVLAAKGEYIIFVDSDDYIKLSTCEVFNKLLLETPNVDIIAANSLRNEERKSTYEVWTQFDNVISGKSFLHEQLRKKTFFVSAWRNVYKKSFLLNNELFFKFGILHEDQQWTPRVILKAETVLVCDYIFYSHEIREGSITQKKDKTKNVNDLIETCKELRYIYENLKENELKTMLLEYLVTLYINSIYTGKVVNVKETVDFNFLKKNSHSLENKFKVKLLSVSESLLYLYMGFRKKYFSKTKVTSYFKEKFS